MLAYYLKVVIFIPQGRGGGYIEIPLSVHLFTYHISVYPSILSGLMNFSKNFYDLSKQRKYARRKRIHLGSLQGQSRGYVLCFAHCRSCFEILGLLSIGINNFLSSANPHLILFPVFLKSFEKPLNFCQTCNIEFVKITEDISQNVVQ